MRLTKRILNSIIKSSECVPTGGLSEDEVAALQDASKWAKEELTRRAELKSKGKDESESETPAAPVAPATTA